MVDMVRSGEHAKLFFKGKYFIKGFKTIPCYAVFYEDKMVVHVIDSKFIKTETKRVKTELKEQHIGLLKRGGRIETYWEEFGKQFADMPQDELLGLDKRNFFIRYDDVTKAVYQRLWEDMGMDADDMSTTHPGHFLLVCGKDKTRIQHLYEKEPSIEKPLENIFRDRIKIRG